MQFVMAKLHLQYLLEIPCLRVPRLIFGFQKTVYLLKKKSSFPNLRWLWSFALSHPKSGRCRLSLIGFSLLVVLMLVCYLSSHLRLVNGSS